LQHPRGPVFDEDCTGCHDGDPQSENNVDWEACNDCHRPGGAYDGVNDPDVENGTLKSGKEKWCATCHDAPDVGEVVFAVDDFEGYASDGALSSVWIGGQDTDSVSLVTSSVPQGSKAMEVDVRWRKNLSKVFGSH